MTNNVSVIKVHKTEPSNSNAFKCTEVTKENKQMNAKNSLLQQEKNTQDFKAHFSSLFVHEYYIIVTPNQKCRDLTFI
jgi:hypothetical protein